MKKLLLLISVVTLSSCKNDTKDLTAQEIIDKSILSSGVNRIKNSEIEFNFRNKHYKAIRNNGKFELSRSFDSILDILSNSGFRRFINKKEIIVPDSTASRYLNAVNSVHYFSVLPFGLNDKAVKKKLLPSTTIKRQEYFKIEVTFSKDGGGDDYEDVFMYWINKESFFVDYLAYAYHTNGGGMRFRVLKEQCYIEGISFVDYINYKPNQKNIKLIDIDKAFETNQLTKVSEVVLKDIQVKHLKK